MGQTSGIPSRIDRSVLIGWGSMVPTKSTAVLCLLRHGLFDLSTVVFVFVD